MPWDEADRAKYEVIRDRYSVPIRLRHTPTRCRVPALS